MENEINLHKRLLSISLRSLNIETHSRDFSRVCKRGERKYTINNNKKIVIIIFLPSLGSSFFAEIYVLLPEFTGGEGSLAAMCFLESSFASCKEDKNQTKILRHEFNGYCLSKGGLWES